jgi:hypothetical protein
MFKEVMDAYSDSCLQLMLGSAMITLGVIILLCFLAQAYGRERSPDVCKTGHKLFILYRVSLFLGVVLLFGSLFCLLTAGWRLTALRQGYADAEASYDPSVRMEVDISPSSSVASSDGTGEKELSIWHYSARIDGCTIHLTRYPNTTVTIAFFYFAGELVALLAFFICVRIYCRLVSERRKS